jgi:hypothetical protein
MGYTVDIPENTALSCIFSPDDKTIRCRRENDTLVWTFSTECPSIEGVGLPLALSFGSFILVLAFLFFREFYYKKWVNADPGSTVLLLARFMLSVLSLFLWVGCLICSYKGMCPAVSPHLEAWSIGSTAWVNWMLTPMLILAIIHPKLLRVKPDTVATTNLPDGRTKVSGDQKEEDSVMSSSSGEELPERERKGKEKNKKDKKGELEFVKVITDTSSSSVEEQLKKRKGKGKEKEEKKKEKEEGEPKSVDGITDTSSSSVEEQLKKRKGEGKEEEEEKEGKLCQ